VPEPGYPPNRHQSGGLLGAVTLARPRKGPGDFLVFSDDFLRYNSRIGLTAEKQYTNPPAVVSLCSRTSAVKTMAGGNFKKRKAHENNWGGEIQPDTVQAFFAK
jgi:hypothetical protein